MENKYFKALGEGIRKKHPQLHDQPDFHEGETVFALRLVSLGAPTGEIDPKYRLHKKEFNAPVIAGIY